MTNPTSSKELREAELCGRTVHWWEGEYDGECELPKDHLEPFHYDGVSYYDDDENNRDREQMRLEALITKATEALLDRVEKEVIGSDENTHWGACNNHGDKSNYRCVCGKERQNNLRAEQRTRLTTLRKEG